MSTAGSSDILSLAMSVTMADPIKYPLDHGHYASLNSTGQQHFFSAGTS